MPFDVHWCAHQSLCSPPRNDPSHPNEMHNADAESRQCRQPPLQSSTTHGPQLQGANSPVPHPCSAGHTPPRTPPHAHLERLSLTTSISAVDTIPPLTHTAPLQCWHFSLHTHHGDLWMPVHTANAALLPSTLNTLACVGHNASTNLVLAHCRAGLMGTPAARSLLLVCGTPCDPRLSPLLAHF